MCAPTHGLTCTDIGHITGSGGNDHALSHYKETSYPLAVKLGTITPEGGDVYSYDEDDMVMDPSLPQHLQHFGIDITSMTKVCHSLTMHVCMCPAMTCGFTDRRNHD